MSIRLFRIVALIECVTYPVLLLAASFAFNWEPVVAILGPIHGVLTLVYAGLAVGLRTAMRWSWGQVVLSLILTLIPLGTLYVEQKMIPSDEELAAAAA